MTRDTLLTNLKNYIRGMSLEEFSRMFINETIAIEEFYKLCHGLNGGKTISLLFNPHRLNIITEASVTRTSAPMSIYQSLSDEGNEQYTEKLDGLARLYLYNLEHNVSNPFYCAIQRGYNGVAYVNEFPPLVARNIFERYGKRDNLRVLDPCCGWGGRMIGCASIPNTTYVGCEPSTQTYNGLCKLGEWLKSLQPSFNYQIYNIPYEEFETDELFDIALTSPPYYDTEHYSDEDTNSLNKFSTFESWTIGFYEPLIKDTVDRLVDGGIFILNIGDRKYPLTDEMNRLCSKHSLFVSRTDNYLSCNDDKGEKFYCITKTPQTIHKVGGKLF